MKTKLIFLVLCAIAAGLGTTSYSQQPQSAPLNPAFIRYMEKQAQTQAAPLAEAERSYGHIPSPIDVRALLGTNQARSTARMVGAADTTFPAVYDLYTKGKVTPVKNQRQFGTCWAHAACASLESCLLTNEYWNFSEKNLANRHGWDIDATGGGFGMTALAYFTRWDGPVDESDDPYPSGSTWSYASPSGPVRKHVQQVVMIPPKTSDLDNDGLKAAIMNYGAVAVAYYHNDYYYIDNYATYNFDGSHSSNHEVTIIGWDDNFDHMRFYKKPPGNGAYLVKNSWGTGFGQYGFFFVSYYDKIFGRDDWMYAYLAEPATNYNVIYQYDPLGMISTFNQPWAANVYTATCSTLLQAVGFYPFAANMTYELYVYTGLLTTGPTAGTLACAMTNTASAPGFLTVKLNKAVPLTNEQRFSVVLRLNNPASEWCQAYETDLWWTSNAVAAPGQSFYRSDLGPWTDFTTYDSKANFCIKAYGWHETIPPTFNNIVVTQAVAKPGITVKISFTSSEAISGWPMVLVNGRTAIPAGSPSYNTNFTYRYTIAPADPEGDATIVITGKDLLGNQGSTTNQTALDVDKTPPFLVCPPDLVLNADPGQPSRSNVNYQVIATDYYGVASLRQIKGLPSGATFPLGITTNIFLATDVGGNTNTAAFTVTVNESMALVVVTSTGDNGLGTLRDALSRAVDGQCIDATRVAGTILLTNGPLIANKSVTIIGPGPGVLAVSGNHASRVFEVTGTNVMLIGLSIVNGAGEHGGGIYNNAASVLTITNCTLSGNVANNHGGGICSSNTTLAIIASTVCSNSAYVGGGILNDGAKGNGMLYVTNCTFHNNYAAYGGGIYSVGDSTGGGVGNALARVVNSTISGHSCPGTAGIVNESAWGGSATLTVNACTFSGNSGGEGGALYSDGYSHGNARLEIGDTILNAGSSGENILNREGTVVSYGYNLSSDNGSGFLTNTCDQINVNPVLGPLQNNGGPTLTHALAAGSSARDKGKCNLFPSLTAPTDQRGLPRLLDNPYVSNATPGGDGSDIGALEVKDVIVTTTADSGPESLRTALTYAQDGDAITFSVGGTITLTTGELFVPRGLRLVGPGPAALMVSGNKLSRVFNVTGTNVLISGLTIANGLGTTNGLGIYTRGTGSSIKVVNCVLTNNSTSGYGAGIYNEPGVTLTVSNCMINGNHAGMGGGIFNDSGYMTLVCSTLSSNCAVSAAAVYTIPTPGTSSIINGCTISSNFAQNASGIINFAYESSVAPLIVNSCTFAGNIASQALSIKNNGWGTPGSAPLHLANNIFNSGPWGGSNLGNSGGTIISKGFNLSSDNGSGFLTNASDRLNLNPRLGPVQDNGGPTWTMALLPGSPAIDQGKRDALTNVLGALDQRGFQRPGDFASVTNAGDASDIGAYEVQAIRLTSPNDSGPGTLREALARAVDNTFIDATALFGEMNLTNGPLPISKSAIILGPGPAALTISGSYLSRVFDITGSNVTLSGLRIADGMSPNGAGIFNAAGDKLTLTNCVVSGNQAVGPNGCGGGIFNSNASLTLIACTISSNSAVYNGKGGAIYNETRDATATTLILASTLHDNSATCGGAVYHFSAHANQTNNILNSTFSGNLSENGGAAINAVGLGWDDTAYVTIHSSTFSGNSSCGPDGAGLVTDGWGAWLEIGNTIFNAGPCGPNFATPDGGVVLDIGYNLSSDSSDGWLFKTNSLWYTNPQLGPLQDNGGLTSTHAPLPTSPAIDHGQRDIIPTLATTTDQRGLPRPVANPYLPQGSGDGSDIGAVEIQGTGGYDTDADGLPDLWELAYFGDLTQSGNDDTDDDGYSNMFEYIAGLNPANEYSTFALQVAPVPGQPLQKTLTFAPWAPGRTYTPLFATNLQTATPFHPLINYQGPTTNQDRISFTDTNAIEPRKYYRIQISQP